MQTIKITEGLEGKDKVKVLNKQLKAEMLREKQKARPKRNS